jgi:thiosulfate/3-mercaptopyruvate sulfurtransferase
MVNVIGQPLARTRRLLLVFGGWVLAAVAWGQTVPTLSPQTLAGQLAGPNPPQVLDARGRAAYLEGSLAAAQDVGPNPEGFLPDSRGGKAILILEPGIDPAPWRARLSDFGYQVHVLDGGMAAWRAAGLPVENPESSFVRPGSVPFIVPRGQCEMGTPSESFH